jgi:hypothetical protein
MSIGVKVCLVLTIVLVAFAGIDVCLGMFNRPWFPGQYILALALAVAVLFVAAAALVKVIAYKSKSKSEETK